MVLIILVLLNISVASAIEVDDASDDLNQTLELSDNILSSPDDEMPEHPDLIDKEYTYVYSSTLDNFFNDGVLDHKFKGKNLIFSGDFDGIGKLEIDCDNVTITGLDSNLKNTVFTLSGNQITLKNLNFNLDKSIEDNDGAAILVLGNDVDLINLNINYIVPKDVESYAIYADGDEDDAMHHLRILNSSIYFEGHNDNVKKYNCALKLCYAYDSVVENNAITSSLPLKEIDYLETGANLDSAYVYTVGIEGCDIFLFNNNTVISDVNKRLTVEYPTLDCFMISKSDDVVISNNSIYMTDFVTYPGVENYLYGLDIHNLNDLWIVNNSISMVTTGGKMASGTAYPIQISGPISGVVIEYNDLYSFSNGPNIGIYSQCYYGPTYLSIRYNNINVTGLAGTNEWALVTGIESQDTFAEIFNNQIEVHSIADVGINDNIYAISYRQSINGPNTFDIENNVAVTDGYYAVYILNSEYSSIINNTLISFNDNVDNGDDAYRQGPRGHTNEDNYDNRVIRAIDYFSQRNEVDNGNIIDIGDSSNSNTININGISGKTQQGNAVNNLITPNFNDVFSKDAGSNGHVDDGSIQATINDAEGSAQVSNNSANIQHSQVYENKVYGENDVDINANDVYGNDLISSNSSSSSTIGVSNDPLGGTQSSSSAEASQSVSKKAYEIDEMTKEQKFIPSILFVILAILLLIVGYKHKRENI